VIEPSVESAAFNNNIRSIIIVTIKNLKIHLSGEKEVMIAPTKPIASNGRLGFIWCKIRVVPISNVLTINLE